MVDVEDPAFLCYAGCVLCEEFGHASALVLRGVCAVLDMAGEELPQLKDANSAEKETQGGKSKRIGSSTGLSRIGSFLTRSFSRHRSRSSRHSKKQDERVRPAEGEAAEVPSKKPICLFSCLDCGCCCCLG